MANDPSERIPSKVIEPVPEFIESFFSKELASSEVEVRIELVDNRFITNHGEEAYEEAYKKYETCRSNACWQYMSYQGRKVR